jgi:hypothetical protein
MKTHLTLFLAILVSHAVAGELPPLPEADGSTIGYRTAAEALASLRARPEVVENEQQGWLLFQDKSNNTLWSFAPKDHPAYPSAVKREIIEKDGKLYVNMRVHCEAGKKACDQLVRDFQELNEQMRQAMQSGQVGQGQ